jgi:beta-glucosidase/6-phospho-beta-glucosidase/beta-galactosidase
LKVDPTWETAAVSTRAVVLGTLDGFSVEGGYDIAGGPTTCYAAASHLGMCAPTGDGPRLWERYEDAIDAAASLGLDGVRLSVEWARVEPRPQRRDVAALARYRRAIEHARSLGLRVTAVALDAAWPSWLGLEPWLMAWTEPEFARHVGALAEELGDVLDGLVTFARPRELVDGGLLRASGPPWRRSAGADAGTARSRISAMHERALQHPAVGALARTFTEVPVVADASALATMIASATGEVHLRSLVRGVGPTASPGALLEDTGRGWSAAHGDLLASALSQATGSSGWAAS